jgi:hypothetical protein
MFACMFCFMIPPFHCQHFTSLLFEMNMCRCVVLLSPKAMTPGSIKQLLNISPQLPMPRFHRGPWAGMFDFHPWVLLCRTVCADSIFYGSTITSPQGHQYRKPSVAALSWVWRFFKPNVYPHGIHRFVLNYQATAGCAGIISAFGVFYL